MDRTKRNISVLEHIVKYCEEILQTHEYFGDTFEEFENNKNYFKSVSMSLLQIGELANHLPKEFTKKYSDVDWRNIVGLRNIIVHGYGTLVYKKIWVTSHTDALELQRQCVEIIAEIKN